MRFRPEKKEITEMNGIERNMADHLIDHLPVELQQKVLGALAKLYPQSANQVHLTGDGKVFIPYGAFEAQPTFYNGSTNPIALATKITHAVFFLLDNDETFRIALSQAFQPRLDPNEPMNTDPILITRELIPGNPATQVTQKWVPPKRNPDGSRPANPSDWASRDDLATLPSLR